NGRWCDNGDGTVTDLLGYNGKGKGLVWLKDAGWGGQRAWRVNMVDSHNDAHTRAGTLSSGTAGLTDGSVLGDWRLPTLKELVALTKGTHQIRSDSPGPFNGIQWSWYWSGTTSENFWSMAWYVFLSGNASDSSVVKTASGYVWPVRGGQ
ncbi:MAG TPA: DUF1566 domain-containing protein, partial [Desulfonatronum sp.]|nr:DUF1566 domain-containing protein [Desulfonatronum sp.]